jgi:4'-phosphopantetheinyl transferase
MDAEDWPRTDRALPLRPDEVHVWQARLDADERMVTELEALLVADERQRADRFYFPRDRRRFVVGRGLLRVLLGEYLSIPPADVALAAGAFGKPHVVGESSLRFNIAHSADLALYAIAAGREVGIDVEQERADVECDQLAQRFFAPEEIAALHALPPAERRTAFFRCWSRKEAYLKALGLGLQISLAGFAVTLTGPVALLHTKHDPAQLDRWELRDLAPALGFAGAVAVEGRGARLVRLRRPGSRRIN